MNVKVSKSRVRVKPYTMIGQDETFSFTGFDFKCPSNYKDVKLDSMSLYDETLISKIDSDFQTRAR